MPKRDYTIDLRHTKPVTLSVVIFLLTAGIAMGALAFLQFTDWIAAFYVFAALPLPISMIFLITKIIIPTLNKSKKDDKKVSIIAFVIYYFSTFVGWAMIWMIIWHVKPDSYLNIDTFPPKDAYNTFGYVLVGASFVCFKTAPAFVLPSALISGLVSEAQITIAWAIEILFIAFMLRLVNERLPKKKK